MHIYLVISLVCFNLGLLLYLYHCWNIYSEYNDVYKRAEFERKFIPTHEWQYIAKDQPLPKGMHVRINMQTGEREAKILDETEAEEDFLNTSLTVVDEGNEEEENSLQDFVKEALKKLKDDFQSAPAKETRESPNDEELNAEKKFRTYSEIQDEVSSLGMYIKTDAEILDELVSKFKSILLKNQDSLKLEDEEALIVSLTDLEYLLHQFDNAKLFVKHRGMADIIVPCLKSNSTRLREIAARVIGSAVQNNAAVQISALRAGVIPYLLRNIALERGYEVRSSSLYALSCLVRSFPFAQYKLVESGGLSVFISLFDDDSENSIKLQLKAISFLSDLLQERIDAEQSVREQESPTAAVKLDENKLNEIKERLKQYQQVKLDHKLVNRGWCSRLGYFLVSNCYRSIANADSNNREDDNSVEHDLVDRTVNAILPISGLCKSELMDLPRFNDTLLHLDKYYRKLIANEIDDDTYYDGIFKAVHELVKKMELTK